MGVNGMHRASNAKENLEELNRALQDEFSSRKKLEDDLLELQVSNAQKLVNTKNAIETAALKNLEDKRQAYVIAAEKKAARKNGGKLSKEEKTKIEKEAKEKFDVESKVYDKLRKAEAKKQAIKNRNDLASSAGSTLFGKGSTLSERKDALGSLIKNPASLITALSDLAKQLDSTIEDIASSQTAIDTRLQGSKAATSLTSLGGNSYWTKMSSNIAKNIGASGLVKQTDVVTNLKSMVGMGISFNVEQRAFLATLKDSIATTFEATNENLRKLVRIQQEDTTAARLGMESALTAFLNNMYETTEYMSEMASAVKTNIYEASALMTAKSATEFEYQIQKWMGSLYSVGFSNTSGLSAALGNLAAGNVSSISDGGYGNLLVMAANKANMSIADILANGLDSSETNQLMQAMVQYLGGIYTQTKSSNILAQQYASVFGLSASDLKAAANLSGSIGNIAGNNLSYGGMLTQLNTMANSIYQRTSLGGLMSNAWSNFQYSTAAGIANNPALYAIYKVAGLLDSTTGGIDFSIPLVMGSGTAQTFNVADILQTAALSGSILTGIGDMLGGMFSSGSGLLSKFGIGSSSNIISRGTGRGLLTTSGATVSQSAYTSNSDSSAVTDKAMTDTTDEQNQKVSAAEEENSEATMTDVNESIIQIYELLQNVTSSGAFKVTLSDGTWLDTGRY